MGSSVLGHVGISVGFSFWDVLWEEIAQGAPGEAGLVAATQTIKETSPLVSLGGGLWITQGDNSLRGTPRFCSVSSNSLCDPFSESNELGKLLKVDHLLQEDFFSAPLGSCSIETYFQVSRS